MSEVVPPVTDTVMEIEAKFESTLGIHTEYLVADCEATKSDSIGGYGTIHFA
jgi:hypothetical protein